MQRRKAGFTLIELMTVLAILAILGALVYPSYTGQMVKARRVEAQLALMEAMQLQEQHRALHHTYLAFSSESSDSGEPGAEVFRWWSGDHPATSAYELEALACEGRDIAECVELRATPGTDNVDTRFADPDCGTLGLDSTGRQTASGPASGCWP